MFDAKDGPLFIEMGGEGPCGGACLRACLLQLYLPKHLVQFQVRIDVHAHTRRTRTEREQDYLNANMLQCYYVFIKPFTLTGFAGYPGRTDAL